MVQIVGNVKYTVVFDRRTGLYRWQKMPEVVQEAV